MRTQIFLRLLIPALLLPALSPAQVNRNNLSHTLTNGKKKPKQLSTELSVGGRLNTNGWGIYADYGKIHSDEGREQEKFHDVRLYTLGFDEIKHPKEIRVTNSDPSGITGMDKPKSYIYGKINNFYSLKLGYAVRKMIAGKPEPGAVSIHWVYGGGIALGMEKPYYLDAYVPQDNGGGLIRKTIRYSDETQSAFLNHNYIIGGAGFAQGLGEIKFVPGIHARTGLHFDFSNRRKLVMAIDAGINAEMYSRRIILMANQDAKPYFVSLYAGLQFGSRW